MGNGDAKVKADLSQVLAHFGCPVCEAEGLVCQRTWRLTALSSLKAQLPLTAGVSAPRFCKSQPHRLGSGAQKMSALGLFVQRLVQVTCPSSPETRVAEAGTESHLKGSIQLPP